jgi:hypothetical protein
MRSPARCAALPPIMGRIQDDRLLLDARTVLPDEDPCSFGLRARSKAFGGSRSFTKDGVDESVRVLLPDFGVGGIGPRGHGLLLARCRTDSALTRTAVWAAPAAGRQCWSGQKWCGGKCCEFDDPKAGCGSTGCEPCNAQRRSHVQRRQACVIEAASKATRTATDDFTPACEVNTKIDKFNCGGCGIDCIATHGTTVCFEGTCEVTICDDNLHGNCDGNKANGCEVDLQTDINNCGDCASRLHCSNAISQCVPEPTKIGDL